MSITKNRGLDLYLDEENSIKPRGRGIGRGDGGQLRLGMRHEHQKGNELGACYCTLTEENQMINVYY